MNNSTEVIVGNTEEYHRHLPWWQQLLFITIYSVMFLVATGGNIIVIWIVLAHKRMRTVTNYFLVNLAVADVLISILNTLFSSTFLMYQDWWYGEYYCKFSAFIAICTLAASVLTFMAIAIDRYMAIIHPLRPRLTSRVVIAIVIIWLVSITLAVPNLIFGRTKVFPANSSNDSFITWCVLEWPDAQANSQSKQDFWYNILIFLITYVLPMATLAATYTRIGIELWGSRTIGENTPVQFERVKSKRKVVKMMIMVVIIFGVCWLPYHLYFILNATTRIAMYKYIQQIYLVIYWMAMSNSMYNPLIYCWMNARFRHGFIQVFCCCPCAPCKRMRTKIRVGRTLFPTGNCITMDKFEKYSKYERNGSSMHTLTDYVEDRSTSSSRKEKLGRRDSDDYL